MPASAKLPKIKKARLDAFLRGLAANPSAPSDVVNRLVEAEPAHIGLARRHDLPPEAAAVLAAEF